MQRWPSDDRIAEVVEDLLTSSPVTLQRPDLAISIARNSGPEATSSTRPPNGTLSNTAWATAMNRARSRPVFLAYHLAIGPPIAKPL